MGLHRCNLVGGLLVARGLLAAVLLLSDYDFVGEWRPFRFPWGCGSEGRPVSLAACGPLQLAYAHRSPLKTFA